MAASPADMVSLVRCLKVCSSNEPEFLLSKTAISKPLSSAKDTYEGTCLATLYLPEQHSRVLGRGRR
jgi:hypothetical protein